MTPDASHNLAQPQQALAPRRVRLAAYLVLALVALAAIAVIDRRAMQRMRQMQKQMQTISATPGAASLEGSEP